MITGSDGELVDKDEVETAGEAAEDQVWIFWRSPTLAELIRTWPARGEPHASERARGWWQPTLEELRAARRKARSIESAAATRTARLA